MADILCSLRSLMASHSPPLDALLVPSEDFHQSEYVSARDKRRQFVSGFTGSAGLALITKNDASLWTDGRYFLQAMQQLGDQWKLMRIGEDASVDAWLSDNLQREAAIGIDPWCVSVDTAQRWELAFAKRKQKLVQTSTNLVDEVWKNRPPAEINPVVDHPLEFSGRSVAEKLKDLRVKLANEKARGIIITALDEVAWLYNIRGSDVSYSPVVHAFAIVTLNSAFLYVEKRKVSSKVNSSLQENGIEVREYGAVSSDVAMLASNQLDQATRVISSQNGVCDNDLIWVDPASCCYALFSKLNANMVLLQQSPLALAKALKNPVELEGLKNAHIRDGAAVVQFLVWLDKQMQEIYGASGYFLEGEVDRKKTPETTKLTEVTVSDKLEGFRASKEHFRGLSFPTISSVGPNAAIIHYSPQAETCAELDPNSIYLFDSGGQYLDGTTDITRTVHFGKPSAHEKACYTSVLKGHIALGNARFPNGTNGYALDILARIPLWGYGLDYRHGTGHGIGSYLNVHEGPHQISFRPHARNVPLQVSMTVTDEPGYYEDGSFGIRLENVLVIKEAETEFNFGDKGYLSFDHITWAPYQIKLIDLSLMAPEEIQWLNTYHSKCREILAPYMDKNEMEWLKKATETVTA
ncbi:putative Minor allergen Alt a [Hibiscus syriacus]|uniref:Xaa-Pro aminopeptidase n=1 Tax=Hibiscus syriacus TaxID=106335 RepID=A0A6A3AKK3_HIBSY|nr:aminopeptidase P1-like [Hibiscus syriacus]KAE8703805.1 putative Minor allergen Alt a [Hibiscus syriacus]